MTLDEFTAFEAASPNGHADELDVSAEPPRPITPRARSPRRAYGGHGADGLRSATSRSGAVLGTLARACLPLG